MKQIITFYLTRLLASASLEYHTTAYNIISAFGNVVSALGKLADDYREAIELQQRAANKHRTLVNTDAIIDKDKLRDAYINRFFKTLNDFLISPVANEKATAKTIFSLVSRFRGVTGYERNKQTGEVRNMVLTLHQPDVWDAADALNMRGIIDQIENANLDFEREMNVRIEGESQKVKLNTAQQRKATEAIYSQIVKKINAVAIVSPTSDTDNCIDRLNALIEEYNRTIASMRTGGTGNEKRKKKVTPEKVNTVES